MKITEKRTEEIEVVTDVRCNRCSKSCQIEGGMYGLIEHEYSTGYHSPRLPDGIVYTFSICEECLADIMSVFQIPAEELNLNENCPDCGGKLEDHEEKNTEEVS